MSTNTKKPPGSIHKIREFELEKIHLSDEFDILQIVGEGWFGKILLVEHRATDTEMVLKALPKPYVSLRDFYREFHYGLHLGVHKNIVTTYDVAFETAGFYVFTQEYAPLGDLTSNVSESGIGDLHSKRVAKQIASALDYMHSKEIVHRDVKLDNVLIYKSDFSRVKLCDFGESNKSGTIVERRNEWLPYSPPEVLQIKTEETYKADPSHDVWQFGIVLFVCLTGCLPWQKAASDDPRYVRYLAWQATNMVLPLRRTPKLFKLLSSKGARMFRKFLEPRFDRRPKNLSDLTKFIDDRWLAKGAEKDLAENEQDVLCASMYSFHSSPEEKNKLLTTLAEYGIETTVDRVAKKNRIKDWIESSVITEEDEEDDSGTPSSSVSREPVAGHISSVRAAEEKKTIHTTIKDSANKHFDPRTGALQSGPSEMGAVYHNQNLGNISNGKNGSFDNGCVITLASRNNLILSEGQSFHSELNINKTQETTVEPMVNARQNLSFSNNIDQTYNSHNNNNNDNKFISNTSNLYNQSLSLNFPDSILTNAMLQRKSSVPLNQSYSVSSLNVNNRYGNYNMINNDYNAAAYNRLANKFQSVATISVPEVNQQYYSSQIKDSGYGSYDKIKPNDKKLMASPVLSKRTAVKKEGSPSSDFLNKSMKDTPYDRIIIRKNK